MPGKAAEQPAAVVGRRDGVRSRWVSAGRVLLPAGLDLVVLALAASIAVLVWAVPMRGQVFGYYLSVGPVLLLVVLGFAQAGLYPGFGLGPVEIVRRYWLVTGGAYVVMAALVFAFKVEDQYSRVTLAIACLLSLVFLPVGRAFLSRAARSWTWWREPVVLVGSGARTARAWELFRDQTSSDFRPVGLLRDGGSESLPDAWGDLPVLGTVQEAREVALTGVQVAFAELEGQMSQAEFDHLRLVFPRVIVLRDYDALPVEGVQVRNLGGALGLEYGNNLLRRQDRWVKRSLDLICGSALLILFLPVMLLAMLTVRLASPGPVLFWQDREGRKGRTIRVPKIRTMIPDADARVEEFLEGDRDARTEWENGFKLRKDPRIIPGIGRVLRRYSIDELPQLWSVVKGDMSLVGPRPFPYYHLESLSFQARRLRNQVRPGLTGLWQVSARGVADITVQQKHDIHYIRNWSIWLDLYILARTFRTVIGGQGAY